MLFVELLVPKGVFDEQSRRGLAARLTARRLLSGGQSDTPATDPGVLGLFDSLSHVVVREEDVWVAGGNLLDQSRDAWYVANVTVGMWGKEMRELLISRITAELAEAAGNPRPQVVVHVMSLPEGSYGLGGRPQRSADFLSLIEAAKTGPADVAPDGMLVDPVCGAIVPAQKAVILERDGQTYGFCCTHCRAHFVTQLGETKASS
jgi:YHS domain-containing protein/phenylpyruvate tautomerase PptA (4-oxalocrotonate tautomerase family)